MKYFFSSIIIILGIAVVSNAQSFQDAKKNMVKANLLSFTLFNTTTLGYERALKPNLSIGGGFGRRFSGSIPSIFRQENFNLQFTRSDVRGYFYNAEARWYLKRYEGQPIMEGFYLGPYLKANIFDVDFDMEYDDGVIVEMNSGELNAHEYGFGVFIGYQLKIWKNFYTDFIFFGPRASRYGFKFNFEEKLSDEFVESIINNINEALDRIFMKAGIDPEVSDLEIKGSFNWMNFRYGISVGLAF